MNKKWTQEAIIAAIKLWTKKYGRPPTSIEWNEKVDGSNGRGKSTRLYPCPDACIREFGSWSNALAAAGIYEIQSGSESFMLMNTLVLESLKKNKK